MDENDRNWGIRSSEDESYNGWANWDTWETYLILSNNEPTYKWLVAWRENFKKKIKKGTFDQEKAREVVRKYLVPVARGTQKRFPGVTGDPDINPKKVNADEILKALMEE